MVTCKNLYGCKFRTLSCKHIPLYRIRAFNCQRPEPGQARRTGTGGNSLANGVARQFVQLFPLVCGGVFVRISPRKAERKD